MSQNNLVTLSGIPQSTISAIENDRVNLGVGWAKTLAQALKQTRKGWAARSRGNVLPRAG